MQLTCEMEDDAAKQKTEAISLFNLAAHWMPLQDWPCWFCLSSTSLRRRSLSASLYTPCRILRSSRF
ncbi:unnamed protein product [Chondrus crispus]|uniref:Uncharacterized protein n=1 Tax=Chondrus crispus TaxID=2769 RepID=R7QLJ5_CHOCR|nr:unnamed protein product [Chondrus crispus]CDF38643.1 unnamed protein product [Chondrus crispus]|eukprot:XP_005718548.1 unnamed protein product [Chondrus crispus]